MGLAQNEQLSGMNEIPFEDLKENAAYLIGKQWMMITAGDAEHNNTMTASWGGLGYLWNRPVAYVFIRPNRYTRQLIDQQESFTLSFMPEAYRKDMMYCGRHSGRDEDKYAQCGLKPWQTPSGLIALDDAELILECRKMYVQEMEESAFLDWSEVNPQYYEEGNPLHLLYIAEISKCLKR